MIYAFEIGMRDSEHRSTINSTTLGKAKAEYLHDIRDCWPDTKFTDIVGRKVGAPHTSAAFLRNANYRGMPDLRCGHMVRVNGEQGFVVGHNDSANFDVLFASGKWKGAVLNCHPSDLEPFSVGRQAHAGAAP